ncbi:hypothetical protein KSC_076260 [Ktedonobacter sp. SOSP1-52]|uniref:ArnT family glycosyltransferase n=1 Tax=Ktedonobacter sp. SOSP1-52 TaxID=2778366 RepID=UPI0019152F10|nr:glycosyltransferase family 39 protein [Ktedonobacter sp. SOSP1-52]GHO68734.1 hypothetical protein KSC_076260 [Ktedonobacter sp. SOSP1-52]
MNTNLLAARQSSSRLQRYTGVLVSSRLIFALVTLAIFVLALLLRLYRIDIPIDLDSYDEGVYWQTLRALSSGHALYQQTFYSQPPFFVLSIFPTYLALGQSLWAARFGVVLISLLGVLGCYCIGYALAGRLGALVAALLMTLDPLYLSQSQKLQAEAPSVAFMTLAVGLAWLWWRHPGGKRGNALVVLCGIVLVLGVLCKLLAVAALVPIGILLLMYLYRGLRQPREKRWPLFMPLLLALGASILAFLVIILPYLGAFAQLWDGVVTFHLVAGKVLASSAKGNIHMLLTIRSYPLLYAALAAAFFACVRRDWRIIAPLAWFLVSAVLLWRQVPLFAHHLVYLVPPMIAMVAVGLAPLLDRLQRTEVGLARLARWTVALTLLIVLFTTASNILQVRHNFRALPAGTRAQDQRVVADMRTLTKPGSLVVTDAQFLAGLADRSTPASLVDTSGVRIMTGYVTEEQLIQEASRPEVQTVLFYTGRLHSSQVAGFHTWVRQHYTLARTYSNGQELWLKS